MTYHNQENDKSLKNKSKDIFSERQKQKKLSRQNDQKLIDSGEVSNYEMQYINGGGFIFKNSKLARKSINQNERGN